tara:strand:+ start:5861 stop:6133 length:273 start_codon:yes stop_codon:yes gene_type:complete
MSEDQRALDLLNELESKKYKHPSQKKAALQCLIIDILKEGEELRAKAAAFDWLSENSHEWFITNLYVHATGDDFNSDTLLEAVKQARGES